MRTLPFLTLAAAGLAAGPAPAQMLGPVPATAPIFTTPTPGANAPNPFGVRQQSAEGTVPIMGTIPQGPYTLQYGFFGPARQPILVPVPVGPDGRPVQAPVRMVTGANGQPVWMPVPIQQPAQAAAAAADAAREATIARVTLEVPPDAEVFVNNKKLTGTGGTRTFDTTPLTPLSRNRYDLRVVWTEKGKKVEQKTTLNLEPGDRKSYSFIANR